MDKFSGVKYPAIVFKGISTNSLIVCWGLEEREDNWRFKHFISPNKPALPYNYIDKAVLNIRGYIVNNSFELLDKIFILEEKFNNEE